MTIKTIISPGNRTTTDWVDSHALPHEFDVRRWLRSLGVVHVDDVIQDAFCRMLALKQVDHITNGRAYFFEVARNLVHEQLRRSRKVRFEPLTKRDAQNVLADDPDPQRTIEARQELALVLDQITFLPSRCRRVFELRKMHRMPQREVSRLLNIPEHVVENDVRRGLDLIVRGLRSRGCEPVVRRRCSSSRMAVRTNSRGRRTGYA